jgi:hypothetical protein
MALRHCLTGHSHALDRTPTGAQAHAVTPAHFPVLILVHSRFISRSVF